MMGSQPKKYLYGQYGVGKTHTLFNIKYKLEESPEANTITDYEVRCRLIDAEFKEKTNYNYLHAQMMEALTLEKIREVIDEYLAKNAGPALEDKLRDGFGDANIARAVEHWDMLGNRSLVEMAVRRVADRSRTHFVQPDKKHGYHIGNVPGAGRDHAALRG